MRSLHDLGLTAWFGGLLMGALGSNGAAGQAKDPAERLRLSSTRWALWAPVSAGAIAAHAVGGAGLILANRKRLSQDEGTKANTWTKAGVTVLAAGLTAYAGALGAKVAAHSDAGAERSVTPGGSTSTDAASAQKQLKVVQFAIPALTGVVIVMGAQQGQQQRPAQQLIGRLTKACLPPETPGVLGAARLARRLARRSLAGSVAEFDVPLM